MELSQIRLVRDDVAIWLIYAGRGRRFYEIFQQSKSVFLNLPGFNATERVFESDELIRRHLKMSDEIFRYVSGARNSPPSRRAANYNPYPYASGTAEAKSFAAELGNIERLFVEAKPGDIVMSPPFGHFDPYLIGEIRRTWTKDDDLEIEMLQGEAVPTRKVRWLNVALARRDFPARVSRRLQNQHAITRVDPIFYKDILDLVYPSYIWGERSKLDVFGDDYKGTDPLQPYASALLVKYVIASVFAFKKDEFDNFQKLSPHDAIEQFYDESLVEEFGQNFNSPGKFSVVAAIGSLSLLASAALIVATSDPSQNIEVAKIEAKDTVKDAMKGADKGAKEAEVDAYVDSMEAVNWNRVRKELGKPSNATMPLNLSNKVEVATHRAELNAR
jgi:hypothetical protein